MGNRVSPGVEQTYRIRMEVLTVSRLADQTLGEVELCKIFPEGMAGNMGNIPAAEVGHKTRK
jgi:hypothetical protein